MNNIDGNDNEQFEEVKLKDIVKSITNTYNKYKSDKLLMRIFFNHVDEILPNTMEQTYQNQIEQEKHLEICSDFIVKFLNEPEQEYFYIENNDTFINYDNINYVCTSEDKIINSVYKRASIYFDENKDFVTRYKKSMADMAINKIKTDKDIFNTIPESITIQNIINFFTPLVFETKTETKYFLTILGDNILKKNSNTIIFLPLKSKNFINYFTDIIKSYYPKLNITKNFKYRYNKSHGYNNTRILYFTNLVSNQNYWHSFINANVFNIIAISCHYSNIHRNSDNFILDQDKSISNKILYFLNKDENKILDIFLTEMIRKDTSFIPIGSDNKISIQEMLYLWKMFANRKQIPNVITKNRLIELLKERLEYNEGFHKVSSNYLDYNRKFSDFFNENFKLGNEEFEISEINLLYKKWLKGKGNNMDYYLIDETKMKNIILHFHEDYAIENNKNITNICSTLWNKEKNILEALNHYKREFISLNKDINILKVYKKYCNYMQSDSEDGNKIIVSKQYFERFIKKHIESGLESRLGEFIMKEYWNNI